MPARPTLARRAGARKAKVQRSAAATRRQRQVLRRSAGSPAQVRPVRSTMAQRARARKARGQQPAAARVTRRRQRQAPRRRAADPPSGSPRDPAAAAAVPDPDFAVEPAPGSQANSPGKLSFFAPLALALALAPSGFPGRFGLICRRHFFPLFPVNPKVETLPCLRWNRGSCLSVARRSRGEILEGGVGGRFCRWLTPRLFLHKLFP